MLIKIKNSKSENKNAPQKKINLSSITLEKYKKKYNKIKIWVYQPTDQQ